MNSIPLIIISESSEIASPDILLKDLSGFPLIQHSIRAAIESKITNLITVCTSSLDVARISNMYGANSFICEKDNKNTKETTSPAVLKFLKTLSQETHQSYDVFIINPTHPFINPETIKSAYNFFLSNERICTKSISRPYSNPNQLMLQGSEFTLLPMKNLLDSKNLVITNEAFSIHKMETLLDKKQGIDECIGFETADSIAFSITSDRSFTIARAISSKNI